MQTVYNKGLQANLFFNPSVKPCCYSAFNKFRVYISLLRLQKIYKLEYQKKKKSV